MLQMYPVDGQRTCSGGKRGEENISGGECEVSNQLLKTIVEDNC